jgi:hypothetical protein
MLTCLIRLREALSKSKINHLTLNFKDQSLHSEYKQLSRETVRERARIYICWLITMLIIFIPFTLLLEKEAFLFELSCYLSTLIVLLVCELICRFNIIGTEFMLSSTVILRGLAIALVTPQFTTVECISPYFKMITYYLNLVMCLSEIILLKTNVLVLILLCIPAFLI